MKSTRKEVPVKNKPGIYKQFYWCEAASTWKPTGKYRAVRRIQVGGVSKREQSFFPNIVDAIKFKNTGQEMSLEDSSLTMDVEGETKLGFLFRDLILVWKKFHFLLIEESTQQKYENLLPAVDFLLDYPVNKIDGQVLNRLAYFWMNDFPRSFRRKSFTKEWQMLRVILQFYKEEVPEGAGYAMPSFKKLKKMTTLVPNVEGEVKYLNSEETIAFLQRLKIRHRTYYYTALLQYFFALRIGEVCALYKDCVDLNKRVITIRRSVHWDFRTWEPKIKEHTKTKRVRYLPIPFEFIPKLKGLIEVSDPKNPLLLPRHDGSPLNRKTIATYYNTILKSLGFTHVSGTHFMRRTSATLANEATGDIDAISRFLGHSSVRVTRRYTGETDHQKQKVSSALSDVFRVDGAADVMFEANVDPQKPATHILSKKLRLISGS